MSIANDGRSAERRDSPRLELREVANDGNHTLLLSGEVDLLTAPELEEAIRRLCVDGTTGIVLDLRKVTFMDSSGLRAMLSAHRLCRQHRYELSVIPGPRQVQSLFQMTGLLELLPFQGDGSGAGLSRDAILPKLFAPLDADDDTRIA